MWVLGFAVLIWFDCAALMADCVGGFDELGGLVVCGLGFVLLLVR